MCHSIVVVVVVGCVCVGVYFGYESVDGLLHLAHPVVVHVHRYIGVCVCL